MCALLWVLSILHGEKLVVVESFPPRQPNQPQASSGRREVVRVESGAAPPNSQNASGVVNTIETGSMQTSLEECWSCESDRDWTRTRLWEVCKTRCSESVKGRRRSNQATVDRVLLL